MFLMKTSPLALVLAAMGIYAATLPGCVVETGPGVAPPPPPAPAPVAVPVAAPAPIPAAAPAVVEAPPAARAPVVAPPREALSGRWAGAGYTCTDNSAPREEQVTIIERGDAVTATKLTGDHCVKAGEVTWRGSATARSFPVQIQVGAPGVAHHFVGGRVDILDQNRLQLDGPGWTIVYRRIP